MYRFTFFIISLFVSLTAISAEPSKIQFALDYHYNLGLSQRGLGVTITRSDMEMHGNSLHATLLYNINSKFTTGVGIGLDRYEPSPNTLPIFATFRYRPFKTQMAKYFYAFTDFGYSVPSEDDDNLSSGILWNLGVGWQKMFRKHFGLNFQFGYNFKQFRANMHDYDSDYYKKFSIYRNSLTFGFGLVF